MSGKVERLRQKESRGNAPLDVTADTGLASGDGVCKLMIGGRCSGGQGGCTFDRASCGSSHNTE